MLSKDEIQAVVQAATLYYHDHINQQQIAEKLHTTRQTVSKLLRNAEQLGIVEFRINNPLELLNDLGEKLQVLFGLQKALVVPCGFDEPDLVASALAPYAGEYLLVLMAQGLKRIGLSWGRTLYRSLSSVPLSHFEDTLVYPLVGSSNRTAKYFMINDMVRRLSIQLNSASAYAYIPADPGNDSMLFKRTAVYESIKSLWETTDLAIVGIGVNPRDEVEQRAAYPGEPSNRYPKDAAVGDLLTHYFDSSGAFLEAASEILCASVEDLRHTRRVLAVAGGREKTAAILGALKTGLLTDLVTDEQTCRRLLSNV